MTALSQHHPPSAAAPVHRAPDTINIAAHLTQMAGRYPRKPAVIWPTRHGAPGRPTYAQLTFVQLEQETDRYAHGLERAGLTRGLRTILMVRPGPEFFALTFALFKVGAVPVLIDPGMGRGNLVNCLARAQAEAFIGVPLAHVLRTLHPGAFRTVKLAVTVGRRLWWDGPRLSDVRADRWQPYPPVPLQPDEPAAILFTSGSTGPAKGVVYTHAILAAQVRYLQMHFRCAPGDIDLATFPLFALFDAVLGRTAVIPDMDASRPGSVDPRRLIATIQDHGCTDMFGSPALLQRLARYGEVTGVRLPTLRRVITAGAPIQPALLESFRRMLSPNAEVHTPYGATEALPVTDIESREILTETRPRTAAGGGTCVGRPLDGLDVRVIEIRDEPIARRRDVRELPSGEIGEIVVKGPVVTRTYFNEPGATAAAKIVDERDGAVWHRMGDVGYFDERGRLWFCGRKAHRVLTEHGTLFTVPCEAIFNQHPRVFRTALVGVGEPGRKRPVLCVELRPGDRARNKDALTRELLELGAVHELTRAIHTVLYPKAFPVDVRHNAKIDRERLAEWATRELR